MCQGIHVKVKGQGGGKPSAEAGLPGCPDRDHSSSTRPMWTYQPPGFPSLTGKTVWQADSSRAAPAPVLPSQLISARRCQVPVYPGNIFTGWLHKRDFLILSCRCCFNAHLTVVSLLWHHDLKTAHFGCLQLLLGLTAVLHSNLSAAQNSSLNFLGEMSLEKKLGFLKMSYWKGLYNIVLALETDSVTQKIACSPVSLLPMIQWLIFSATPLAITSYLLTWKSPEWWQGAELSFTIATQYLHSHATPVQDWCPVVTSPTRTGIENDPCPVLPGEQEMSAEPTANLHLLVFLPA